MPLPHLSRRNLLIGGGVGVGLVVGFALWPRDFAPGLNTAPGEHGLNGFLKIGEDGHVVVVVPQVELGHGVFTVHAQIVADELGADWRTVGVEAARAGALYANTLLMHEWDEGLARSAPARLVAARHDVLATGGSTSVRGFEGVLRDAGAAARALLCKAAAERWDADWQACDTHDGFVWRGEQKMRFGEVAAEAAKLQVPGGIAWRSGNANRLVASEVPRLDLPSKVDGSVNFAGDVRLPDMVFAAIAEGPVGDATLKGVDRAAAAHVPGFVELIENERWVAVAGVNSWAAQAGLKAANPRFAVEGALPTDRSIARALDAAFDAKSEGGERLSAQGDITAAFSGASVLTQSYHVGFAPHATLETGAATVQIDGNGVQVWAATQAPGLTAQAVARALNVSTDNVIVHPMMVGGSFGARWDSDLAAHAAVVAERLKRPVQLMRPRAEEMRRDTLRPASQTRLAARVAPDGRIAAWFAQIAAPAALHELDARIMGGKTHAEAMVATRGVAEPAAIMGAVPPYDIPVHAIDHHPASLGVPVGDWRGRAWVANTFASECFVDEIAHTTGGEPFSTRMGMLGANPRLAQCLTKVAAAGGWMGGGQGSNQGLAVCTMAGSHIAVMAEAQIGDDGRVRVTRLRAVADVGRVIHPGVVRSQIIGGLIFGMAAATGAPVSVKRGIPGPERYGDLRLPRMADCPQIEVELIVSREDPGGASELGVPAVAPAVAGALFAATGVRYRQLPLVQDAR